MCRSGRPWKLKSTWSGALGRSPAARRPRTPSMNSGRPRRTAAAPRAPACPRGARSGVGLEPGARGGADGRTGDRAAPPGPAPRPAPAEPQPYGSTDCRTASPARQGRVARARAAPRASASECMRSGEPSGVQIFLYAAALFAGRNGRIAPSSRRSAPRGGCRSPWGRRGTRAGSGARPRCGARPACRGSPTARPPGAVTTCPRSNLRRPRRQFPARDQAAPACCAG